MRLLICTKADLTSVITLNALLARLGDHEVRILVSTATSPRHSIPEAEQLAFYERDLPFDLLFPLIDKNGVAGRWRTLEGLKRHYGIRIDYTNSLESPMARGWITGFRPDLILSFGFDLLFGPDLLSVPALGAVNIHPGFLPRYAGTRAPLRALIDREQRMGCTLHLIDSGITSGPILAEDSIPVTDGRSLHSYKVEVYLLGAQLFLDALDATLRGRPLTGVPQLESQRRPGAPQVDEQYRRLRELGISTVNPGDYTKLLKRFYPEEEKVLISALGPLWTKSAA